MKITWLKLFDTQNDLIWTIFGIYAEIAQTHSSNPIHSIHSFCGSDDAYNHPTQVGLWVCVWVICAMVSGERVLSVYELNCGCVCVCVVRFETVYYYFIFNSIISHDNKPIHEYDWRNGNVWVMLLLCQCDRVSRRIHHVMLDVYSTAAATCNVWIECALCRYNFVDIFRSHFNELQSK